MGGTGPLRRTTPDKTLSETQSPDTGDTGTQSHNNSEEPRESLRGDRGRRGVGLSEKFNRG